LAAGFPGPALEQEAARKVFGVAADLTPVSFSESLSAVLVLDFCAERICIGGVPLERGNSTVFDTNYHTVSCPKYRKRVLVNEVKDELEVAFRETCKENDWTVIELDVQPDHIHSFISAHPRNSPTDVVKKLKGISAKIVFENHPDFRREEYWGRHLWSAGYYVGTAGVVTAEAIEKYICANSSDH